MIHEAYMPVYMGSRFLARDGTGHIKGSTRGPRGPKNKDTNKRHIIVNRKVVYKVSPCWYYMPNPRLFLEIRFSETSFEAEI